MKDDRQERGWTRSCLAGTVLVLMPIFYVLSFGPIAWLAQHSYMPMRWYEVVYYPLVLAAKSSDWINAVLDWYLHFWVV